MKNNEFTNAQKHFLTSAMRNLSFDELSATQVMLVREASAVLCYQVEVGRNDTERLDRYSEVVEAEVPSELLQDKRIFEVAVAIQSGISNLSEVNNRPTFVEFLSSIFEELGEPEEPFDKETKQLALSLIVGSALRASTHFVNEKMDEDEFMDQMRVTDGYKHFEITTEVSKNAYRFKDQPANGTVEAE